MSPESIVVVQIGKIGDMILTTPLFKRLREEFPDSKLTVLASEINNQIAVTDPSVSEVVIFKKNFSGLSNLISLRNSKIDYWIDTKEMYSRTSGLLLKKMKPEKSFGYNSKDISFNVDLTEYRTGSHAVDLNLSPLNYFSGTNEIFSGHTLPEIFIPSKDIETIKSRIGNSGSRKKILINYSAGSGNRYIQPDIWINTLNNLSIGDDFVFYISGKKEDLQEMKNIIKEVGRHSVNFINTDSLFEFAGLIKLSDLVITPDTSAVHFCSAFDKPVIAFYPDVKWNFEKFKPLSKVSKVIFSDNGNDLAGIKTGSIIDSINKILPEVF
ncbi:MAG: glycosyltransferase family 9 protein [Bacteroidetes bacterium]|nr:glycosyltransferase family 9 protein [Bacteroidota bacterium]